MTHRYSVAIRDPRWPIALDVPGPLVGDGQHFNLFGAHECAAAPSPALPCALADSARKKAYILLRMENRVDSSPRVLVPMPRTWDARLARRLVTPLKDTRVTPNHLTTLRLIVGLAGAAALAQSTFGWLNVGAALIVLSNFIDHTDGELARISGKSSRFGHFYDLASDACVTIALFVSMGIGVASAHGDRLLAQPTWLGGIAGVAVALIFYLRMRIEAFAGKAGTRQASAAGFETEDVLYMLPLVTLTGVVEPFVIAASIGAPVFAVWVALDYRRIMRRTRPSEPASEAWVSR